MLTIGKSAITLGVLGAMIAATTTPTLARSHHVRGHTHYYSQQYRHDNGRGAYAQQPPSYRGNFDTTGPGYFAPRATIRPNVTWDPYGMRWDSAD